MECKRCLLKDLSNDEYFKSIFDYIQSLPKEDKTPQKEYEERLLLCQTCDNLINGMCRLCGCFVEVRAAKKRNHCAGMHQRW